MLSIRTTVQTIVGAGAMALLGLVGTAQAQSPHWAPASQGSYVTVQFNAPPAPRYEAVPAPRRGHVWAPGYWEPRGHRHVWRAGHWVQSRPGYVYRQPTWKHHGNRWDYQGSRWDRDGDGVPNRHDRTPNNPHRRSIASTPPLLTPLDSSHLVSADFRPVPPWCRLFFIYPHRLHAA